MKTPEQEAADRLLTTAIEMSAAAYLGEDRRIVGPYVVVAAESLIRDDGTVEPSVMVLNRDDATPSWQVSGLLREGLLLEDAETLRGVLER